MPVERAREELKIYGSMPELPRRMHLDEKRDQFVKRYGIMIVLACIYTLSMILCSAIASKRTEKAVWEQARAEYAVQLEEYKREQREAEQASYFLSGNASHDAAINQDATELAKDGGVWKNETAFKTYCWNVALRKLNAQYPNSVKEILAEPNQYDFYNASGTYTTEKFEWAKEVLEQAETGMLPRYFTTDHVYLEMRGGGTDCVLHTNFPFYTNGDDPTRLKE